MIVRAFANYGFAGTEMEFEEEFPDDATDEEIEETMKDIYGAGMEEITDGAEENRK